MKREMTLEEEHIAEQIFRALIGLTLEQAELILKTVAAQVKERARIEEG